MRFYRLLLCVEVGALGVGEWTDVTELAAPSSTEPRRHAAQTRRNGSTAERASSRTMRTYSTM